MEKLSHLSQRIGLALNAALGLGAGLAFALAKPGAFNIMFGTFLWSLGIGAAITIIASVSGRIEQGDWRAGLLLSGEIFFADAAAYMIALVLVGALGPTQTIAGDTFGLLTMLRVIGPGIVLAASLMTLSSVVYFLPLWRPARRRYEQAPRQSATKLSISAIK